MTSTLLGLSSASSRSFSETTATTNIPVEYTKAILGVVDIVIVVVYIILTLLVGVWASRRGKNNSVQGYFLAGRHMTWLPVGASLFASNIGTGHFIGLAGTGAASGIAIGSFEWIAPYNLLQLGWLFLPIYLACEVYTMPEYLHKRFGGARLRVTLSVLSLALYILTKIAVDLFAGALFIQQAFNVNLYLAIITLLVVTAIYTVLGGLKAVIYTDTMQTIIMLVGGIMLMVIGFSRVGGYENLKILYMKAIPQTTKDAIFAGNTTTCGMPRNDSFHIFRDPVTSDLPWPGMLLGIYFLGSWYWCTDQVIVQRALATKTIEHAKAGCVLAGFLKIIPMYMIVMTGMISRVLFPNEVACADATECQKICGNKQSCSNIAYPKLVLEILPSGIRGVVVAAMLSALVSSLTSIFNSTSTIFTIDVWKRIRTKASEKEMLIVGKLTVCVLVVISILWIPVLLSSAGGQLFIYIQSIQSALGPPIFALYFLAILWPRVNEQGAFWGLISGFTAGVIRLVLDFVYGSPNCDEEEFRPWILHRINYLHVSPIVFVISSATTLVISYCTEPLPKKQLLNTTWFTRKSKSDLECQTEKLDCEISENQDKELTETPCIISTNIEEKKEENIREKSTRRESFIATDACNKGKELLNWNIVINGFAIALALAVAFLFGYYA